MIPLTDSQLLDLLKGVSRSFVLTIRALPRGLRRPIGLAYLLARASDTIADTATAPILLRAECLRSFNGILAGEPADAVFRQIEPSSAAERLLLENLGRVAGAVGALPKPDAAGICALLEKITRGQELDLLRFPDPGQVRGLETASELNEYTYLVAGCVGEFWTRICHDHVPRYGKIDPDQLCRLGRGFGQALQLINILRDIPEDIANGRCYLPLEELRAEGVSDANSLRQDLRLAGPVFERWRQRALQLSGEARSYIEAIRPWRIRYACLLPWALGIRTLKLMATKSPLESGSRVKVSRKEVVQMTRRAVWAACSNHAVRAWSEEG